AAADRPGPGVFEGPAHPHPRRGHLRARRRVGVHRPAGAGRLDQGSNRLPDRPSPFHRAARSPDRGIPRGAHRRDRTPRRVAGGGRFIPPPACPSVLPVPPAVSALPITWPAFQRARNGVLAAFFLALAFSISCSQALLAVLFVLVLPWATAFRT